MFVAFRFVSFSFRFVLFVENSYKKLGILIAHEGMILENKNLLHASSKAGKTVEVDFLDYYFNASPIFLIFGLGLGLVIGFYELAKIIFKK